MRQTNASLKVRRLPRPRDVALPFVDANIYREIGVLTRRGEPLTAPAAAFKRLLFLTTGSEGELLEESWQPLNRAN